MTLGSAPSIPATTIRTRAALQAFVLVQQTMQAGDADVVETIDRVAHDLRGHRRFLGDGKI